MNILLFYHHCSVAMNTRQNLQCLIIEARPIIDLLSQLIVHAAGNGNEDIYTSRKFRLQNLILSQ